MVLTVLVLAGVDREQLEGAVGDHHDLVQVRSTVEADILWGIRIELEPVGDDLVQQLRLADAVGTDQHVDVMGQWACRREAQLDRGHLAA